MSDKAEAVKEAVTAPVEHVSEAVKTYVRDELGRFASKETAVKDAAVAMAEKIAGEPMTEIPPEQLKDVAGGLPRGGIDANNGVNTDGTGGRVDGPHGSW